MSIRRFAAVIGSCVLLSAIITCGPSDAPTRPTGNVTAPVAPRVDIVPGTDPVIVAAGDAVCGTGTPVGTPCQHAAVATLITSLAPNAVLLLGDNQYENGTLADYNTYYNATWGAFKNITYPAPGNHEYNTAGAKGYYDYFNGVGVQVGRAGDRAKGYYSYNMGAWHIVALNSNCSAIGGCGAGSAQEQWLRADLAANSTVCTLAYWHHPRFSSGGHGNDASTQPLWQALYDMGADVVLNGHDHDFERFAPQTPAGVLDEARGVREFVVGTGGKEQEPFAVIRANSQLRASTSFGVLQLALRPTAYEWQFRPIAGNPPVDAGSAQCSPIVTPPPPPTQTTLTIAPSADSYVFKDKANGNYGNATTLLVDGSPAARTFFKFAVTGIGTKQVVSAKLRVYAVDPSDAGGNLHRVPTTTWSETSIKWNNAPAYNAAILGSIGAVVSGSWYEIDVTNQIAGDGTLSFALESSSANGADYRSREGGAATAPRLVIVLQ